ncbi:hypothetical protein OCU04_011491 [Sclerotinia nivalis]|uniref:Fork-head domain-containing protein n=1 Tax=Sclerotinia nivalis TaxID=352851 RepID=A0A9X0ABU7_9HELO|nr:hypothetical protein OCU04_011491 [Sclerotinia nivalis]
MTSSQTAETVTQPIAPVATMSTTNFALNLEDKSDMYKDLDKINLNTHALDSHDNIKSCFAEQDKSATTTMDTTLPSTSIQPMDTLPENICPSPPKEAVDAAKEMEKPELASLENEIPSLPKAPIDSAMEICDAEIEEHSHEKESAESKPEVDGHLGEEPTAQPTQKQSQSPPNKSFDSFPPCNMPNQEDMMVTTYQEYLDQGAKPYPEIIFDGSLHPHGTIVPDQTFDNNHQAWIQTWDPNHTSAADSGVQLDGYAKLVFDDSEFYMTTHQVIIGRDVAAYNNMKRYEKEQAQIEQAWNTSDFTVRPTVKIENRSAGIVDPWITLQPESRRSRKERKSKNLESGNPLSHSGSVNSSNPAPFLPLQIGNSPMPNPDFDSCPVIYVHPPFDKGIAGFKAISREHVRIFYDNHHDNFQVEFLGRNGGFVDGVFYEHKQIATLKSGSKLQMGFIYVRFMLPDVVIDDTVFQYDEELEDEVATGTTTYSEGGKEMSLSFDDAPRAGDQRSTDNSECSTDDGNPFVGDENTDNEDQRADDDTSLRSESLDNIVQHRLQNDEEPESPANNPTDTSPKPAKKRGPGRPPKNGVMSKREQQIAKKEALERERIQEEERAQEEQRVQEQNQATASKTVPGKNKVGRPRKHPRPDVSEEGPPRQKRKYTKRQSGPKEPEDADEDRFDDDGNCIQTKSGSSRKVAYVLKEVTHKKEECTVDQLTKPPTNYLQTIWELLHDAEQPLCLPQIYNEMEVKYPYYAFQESKGWQSSVRHNLGQHECFERTKRAGKGWAWCIRPGMTYLKEKKKKAPSPPVAGVNQPIYQAGHPVPGYGPNQMQPPAGYMLNPQLYHNQMHPHPQGEYQQYQQGQPYMGPNHHYTPYPAQGYAPPHAIQPPFIPPMAPQLAPTAPMSYSSPYAPKPPAATTQSQGTQQQQQPPPQQAQQQQQQLQQQHPQQIPYQTQGVSQPPISSQSTTLPQQQQQPQPLAGSQSQIPPQAASQAASVPAHQKRVIPPNLIAAVTGYRNHVVNLMRQRAPQNDAEALVDKAIKRVYDGTEEDRSLDSTEHEMKLINGVLNVLKLPLVPRTPPANPSNRTQQQHSAPQQPFQPSVSQHKPQGNTSQQPGKASGSDIPKQPTIMRPSFYGNNQNQPGGPSVPRPPLVTPALQRNNSVSAQNAPPRPSTASSSPAPANPSNPPPQASTSSNNKTGGATSPVTNTVSQTIAQAVDQNVPNHGLKVGETLTEAGFVRSFPQPQIST